MKVVLVAGMHRSATSLVAKGLHDAGCSMGRDMIDASKSNPQGHYECRRAVTLNDQILKASGGTWRRPPASVLPETLKDQVSSYVKDRSDRGLWGVKDPRICLTWPVWLPILREFDLHVIRVNRNPVEVARSLNKRDGIPLDRGVELAERYNTGIDELMENLWE